jgi:hypothetical protein
MAPPQLRVGSYNPAAYVPGNAPRNVARAIQTKGIIRPPTVRPPTTPYAEPSIYEDPGVPGMTVGDPANPMNPVFGTYNGQPLYTIPDDFTGVIGPDDWAKIGVPAPGKPYFTSPNPLGERPDLKAGIEADPEVQGAITNKGSRLGVLEDQFTAAIRRAAINLGLGQKGMDIGRAGKFGGRIDTDTIQKAIENKYSQNTQIQNQQDRSQSQMAASLAGRGGLNSGQLVKSSGDIGQQAEQNRYDALQSFLGQGEAGLTDIANQSATLDQAIATARGNAGGRVGDALRAWLLAQNEIDTAPYVPDETDPTPVPPFVQNPLGPPGARPAQPTRGIVVPRVQHVSTFGARPKKSYPGLR